MLSSPTSVGHRFTNEIYDVSADYYLTSDSIVFMSKIQIHVNDVQSDMNNNVQCSEEFVALMSRYNIVASKSEISIQFVR